MKTNSLAKVVLLIVLLSGLSVRNGYGQVPTVSGFSPLMGSVGAAVVITGTNFNTTPENNIVFFGATRAMVNNASSGELSVTVPVCATFDFISVLNSETNLIAYSDAKFLPIYTPNSGSIEEDDFEEPLDFPIDVGSKANLAVGDLDGDGLTDVAAISNYMTSVFRNTSTAGTVSFAPRIDYPEIQYTRSVSIGELDGDGKPEMIVANIIFDTQLNNFVPYMTIYRNTSSVGTISFADTLTLYVGYTDAVYAPYLMHDMDGDGKSDVVIMGNGKVSIFRNTSEVGAISFAERVDTNTPFVYTYELNIGDLDGDGKPDVAIINNLSASITVMRNISDVGEISFDEPVTFESCTFPEDVSVGDLDNDGKLDLAVIGDQFNISLFRNTSTIGTIGFDEPVNIITGANASCLPLGDLDGDGKLDMVTTDEGYQEIFIYRNISEPGTISYAENIVLDEFGNIDRFEIADIDGDGVADLIGYSGGTANIVKVIRNKSVPTAISEVDESTDFTLYPNPANNTIFIKQIENSAIQKMEIMDASGRIVRSLSVAQNGMSLDISDLEAGEYIVKLQTSKGESFRKFTKM